MSFTDDFIKKFIAILMEELKKVLEQYFPKPPTPPDPNPGPQPDPGPNPQPDPGPNPQPDPGPQPDPEPKHIIIADMLTIPDRMRQQGWVGSDNELWYALCHVYADIAWYDPYNNPVSTALYNNRDNIYKWWDNYILDIAKQMRANTGITATIITNDENDRGGLYLGPAIMKRLQEFEGRIEMGIIYNPWGL